MDPVITTYLEMTSLAQLKPGTSEDPHFVVTEAVIKQWQFNRFLYSFVGEKWQWTDKLAWTGQQWRDYAERDELRTFVGYCDGSPAGYFELLNENDAVEIAYFGLAERFIGKKLGGYFLTQALEQALRVAPQRVWVHTCTLDHPAALGNYLARGMVIYNVSQQP